MSPAGAVYVSIGLFLGDRFVRRGSSGRHGNTLLYSKHLLRLVCRMTSAEERLTAHEVSSREEAHRLQMELDKYARSTYDSLHANDLACYIDRVTQVIATSSLHQDRCWFTDLM